MPYSYKFRIKEQNEGTTELDLAIAALDYIIVAGDFSARVGRKDQTPSKVLGNFGLGQGCETGDRLVNYALMNQLTVSNTLSAQAKPPIIWYSSNGTTKSKVEYVLILQQWRSSVQDSRSYKEAATGLKSGSDHKLIVAKIFLCLAVHRKNKAKHRIESSKLLDEN
ncbi:hypothetical protein QYM36_003329, partial [Artemia franciscana]